jgi:hypothetical protein
MTGPWMKFFPSDWRADPSLRMCSVGARGLWMELLCIMHEAQPRGSLVVNGRSLNDRQIAALAGARLDEVSAWLAELEDAGVFSREDDGTIYSRRMRRDVEKEEADKANGRKGGNPTLKAGVNPPVGKGDKAHMPEARKLEPDPDKKDRSSYLSGSVAAKPAASRPVAKAFPADGSISYGPFAEISRRVKPNVDPDRIAQAFRDFCHSQAPPIPFDDPRIERRFEGFARNHQVRGH